MFNRLLALCEKQGFLKKTTWPRLNLDQLKLGPTGLLLQKNLETEWFNSVVINKETSVFLSKDNILDTFDFAKSICLEKLPFAIAEVMHSKKTEDLIERYEERMKNDKMDFGNFFASEDKTILKCSSFVSSDNATTFFHQWQKQRRMWWRKFSPSPGRYSLTDIKKDDNNTQSVAILAQYPWGSQVIETLILNPVDKIFSSPQLKFKEGKKAIESKIIVSVIDTSIMFLNTVSDAFDEPLFQGKPRELLRFHRKLAPYKISFSITAATAAVLSELNDLALYLCKQLRTNQVSTLFLPSSLKFTLDAQWKQYDQLGIPYNVLLNENTLKNGIAQLRCRDTTLKEQVHVTELVPYVEQLFKNY